RYFQQSINQINNASGLVNTLSSSVSYSKTLPTEPEINYTVAATHSQNTNTQQITMSLPNVNGNVSRVFPFAPKVGAKKGVVDNINLQYSVQAQNRVITTDSLFFKPEMFDNLVWGARHSVPLSTNFKVLGYLSASASANYTETWVGNTTRQRFDPSAGAGAGAVVTDTVRGFDAFRTYSFGSSLGTTVYGTFNFGGAKKIQAIRHVIRPSVSFGVTPGFGQYYEDLVIPSADPEVNDEVRRYSRFERSLFGAPNQNFSSSLGFSLSNTLEAKVAPRDTTVTEPKKVTLLRNFNLSSSYNLAGDSLRFNPVGFTGGIPIVEKLDLNFNGSLDPYALDNNNRRIGVFNIKNGGSLFRLTNANISMNYSFSSRDFEGDRKDTNRLDNETFRNGGRPDDLFGDALGGFEDPAYQTKEANKKKGPKQAAWYNYKIPWNLRLAYTITYNNAQRQDEISSQSLMASSNLELSPRWTVGVSSGYDFKNKGVTLTQLRFERDLESWQMRFTWTPIGARNTSWYFFIGIRGVLSDIKYDKRRTPDRDL
ncbi:MAG: putative LPS assembly protein LptD, partial [Marinirhabdus sp.]